MSWGIFCAYNPPITAWREVKFMRTVIVRGLATLVLLVVIGNLRGQNAKDTNVEDFRLEGVGIWQCQCPAYRCPCQQNGLPTHGMCHASDFAHIKKGHYGNVNLDGLSLVVVGNLVGAKPERLFGTLYIDKAATPAQSDALTHIFEYLNSAANDPPVPLRGIKAVPITFQESADRTEYSVVIPATLEEKARLKRDKAGKPQFTMPAMDLWDNTVHNADNVQFKYHDSEAGEAWDYSGHYTNLKFFDVSKTMYAEQQMLGQHGDNSGKWTLKQVEIIQQQGLK
jgi:hypothetical protein